MLDINLSTILLQIANFLILAFILYRFLFKPLQTVLNKRADEVTRQLTAAEEAQKAAEEAKQFYEEKKDNIDVEINARKNEARVVIEKTRQQMLSEVQSQIEQYQSQAEETLSKIREEALMQHKQEIGTIAGQFTKEILTDLLDEKFYDELQKEFLDRIRKTDFPPDIQETTGPEIFVKVIFARTSSNAFQKELTEILKEKTERPLNISYEEDPALIAGCVLRFEDILIDGSLQGMVRKLQQKYQETL
jgi:F-type H+-transporting ATPase subunit b